MLAIWSPSFDEAILGSRSYIRMDMGEVYYDVNRVRAVCAPLFARRT